MWSFKTGQCEYIQERRTIGSTEDPYIKIRSDDETQEFQRNNWSNPSPNIEIFDSVFINDNIYTGNYIDLEHKKNLYRIIIGEQGVKFAKKIENLDIEIRKVSATIRHKKEIISKIIPQNIILDEYLNWAAIAGIDQKIKDKHAEIVSCQKTLEKETEIQTKEYLNKIQLPSLPTNYKLWIFSNVREINWHSDWKLLFYI